MNTRPTPDQVATEIAELENIRDKGLVPEFSLFDDDNYAAIDAQIMVLRDGHEAAKAASFCVSGNGLEYIHGCAQDAQHWRDGVTDAEPPSAGWGVATA